MSFEEYLQNNGIEINGDKYIYVKKLGQGGAGEVFRVKNSESGKPLALKKIKDGNPGSTRSKRFKEEIEFSVNSSHENIIKFIAHEEMRISRHTYYACAMELADCDLSMLLKGEIEDLEAIDYAIGVAKGLKYIHDKGIIHRDLKPQNILIFGKTAVISDFGIAHFYNSDYTAIDDDLANKNYNSPEQRLMNNATNIQSSTDIYSFGLILNEIFTGEKAIGLGFKEVADTRPHLKKIDLLIKKMIRYEPTLRPSINSVLFDLMQIKDKMLSIKEYGEIIFEEYSERFANSDVELPENLGLSIAKEIYSVDHIADLVYNDKDININFSSGLTINSYKLSVDYFNQILNLAFLNVVSEKFKYEQNSFVQRVEGGSEFEFSENLYYELNKFIDSYGGYYDDKLKSEILQKFITIRDYHRDEIYRDFKNLYDRITNNWTDGPIAWWVSQIYWVVGREKFKEIFIGEESWGWDLFDIDYEFNPVLDDKIHKGVYDKKENSRIVLESDSDTYRIEVEHEGDNRILYISGDYGEFESDVKKYSQNFADSKDFDAEHFISSRHHYQEIDLTRYTMDGFDLRILSNLFRKSVMKNI